MPILTLLMARGGGVHPKSGLNWGFGKGNTRRFDALIPLHVGTIRANFNFFTSRNSSNNRLVFKWDDGVEMGGQFEGTQTIDNRVYAKNISSHPHKDTIGLYLRGRLGITENRRITMDDLRNYGRTTIDISHIEGNIYYLDFSVM